MYYACDVSSHRYGYRLCIFMGGKNYGCVISLDMTRGGVRTKSKGYLHSTFGDVNNKNPRQLEQTGGFERLASCDAWACRFYCLLCFAASLVLVSNQCVRYHEDWLLALC